MTTRQKKTAEEAGYRGVLRALNVASQGFAFVEVGEIPTEDCWFRTGVGPWYSLSDKAPPPHNIINEANRKLRLSFPARDIDYPYMRPLTAVEAGWRLLNLPGRNFLPPLGYRFVERGQPFCHSDTPYEGPNGLYTYVRALWEPPMPLEHRTLTETSTLPTRWSCGHGRDSSSDHCEVCAVVWSRKVTD